MRKLFVISLLLLVSLLPLSAQDEANGTVPATKERGDYITMKLAVIGPGDALYLKWGHIGIIVEDALSGKNRFYDYGLFSFETENFFANFAFGRFIYSVGVSPSSWNLNRAIYDRRKTTLLTLNLPAEKKEEIWAYLENNVRPENRNYLYHHFNENCATRLRDILDKALDGQLKEQLSGASNLTLREQTMRHLEESPFFKWFLPFLMGPVLDEEITKWDELFLPSAFIPLLEDFSYTDADGESRKLVSEKVLLNDAPERMPVPATPAPIWPWTLLAGSILALGLGMSRLTYPSLLGRMIQGVLNIGCGLFFGSIGSILFFMSLFTDHDITYNNINLLFVNPLMLVLIPLGIRMMGHSKRTRAPHSLFAPLLIWTILASGALVALLAVILGVWPQKDFATLVLVLPAAVTMSYYPSWIFRKNRSKKRKK